MTARHLLPMLRANNLSPSADAATAPKAGLPHASWAGDQKPTAPVGTGLCLGLVRARAALPGRSLHRQAARRECEPRAPDCWACGFVFQGVPGNETQKSSCQPTPPSPTLCYIWNRDCYLSKCLLENIQTSACHRGSRPPLCRWSPSGLVLPFRVISG